LAMGEIHEVFIIIWGLRPFGWERLRQKDNTVKI